MRKAQVLRFAAAAMLLASAACGGAAAKPDSQATLRLGSFPNITHATAIAGVEKGIFARALGAKVTLQIKTFNAGPEAVEALFAEALDATYIGPNPAINAYAKSKGEAVRVIAGATSGGAALVVKPSIKEAAGLRGKKVASPQRGNTQDVALRAWLARQGLKTTLEGAGDVQIVPQPNVQTLETFRSGAIQGAWVPEPWATRLVVEGGGKVLVNEASLWPAGRFVTTHLLVRTKYLREHPDVVRRLLAGHVEATKYLNENATDAKATVNEALKKLSGKALTGAVIDKAWSNLTFTVDPIASSLARSAADAIAIGLLQQIDLKGLYELAPLNRVLAAANQKEVVGL
jgi:sulfonate transport system substrate-binding protein